MRTLAPLIFLVTGLGSLSAAGESTGTLRVDSPNRDVSLHFRLSAEGVPAYAVLYKQMRLLRESGLGLRLGSGPDLDRGFSISGSKVTSHKETWTPVAGERREIRNHYNQLAVTLTRRGPPPHRLLLKFHAYNEGAALCYVIPEQENLESFTITEDLTRFHFGGDHFCWDTKDPQGLYRRVPISEVGKDCGRPLVVEVPDGPFVALGEARLVDYGKKHGIGVILYVNRRALEKQLDELLPLFRKWGVAGIKFGFVRVGTQQWTKWVHDSVRKCAEHRMVVDIHDDYRPTGWSRTYPNLLTQEGIKGNETMPTAGENVTLPFTRYLCGPADYTVCYYSSRIKTTRAHQLAASIVYFSPLQLLFWYDKPAQFRDEPELEVFKQLHTTWDDTRVIHGEIGKFITTARRKGDQWFVGSMNAGERRTLDIPLSFLDPGVSYTASIHSDANPEGTAPKKVASSTRTVTSKSILTADMADNGGQAVILTPARRAR